MRGLTYPAGHLVEDLPTAIKAALTHAGESSELFEIPGLLRPSGVTPNDWANHVLGHLDYRTYCASLQYTDAAIDHHLENVSTPMWLDPTASGPGYLRFDRTPSRRSRTQVFHHYTDPAQLWSSISQLESVVATAKAGATWAIDGFTPATPFTPILNVLGDAAFGSASTEVRRRVDKAVLLSLGFTELEIRRAPVHQPHDSSVLSYGGDGMAVYLGYPDMLGRRDFYFLPTPDVGLMHFGWRSHETGAGGAWCSGRVGTLSLTSTSTPCRIKSVAFSMLRNWSSEEAVQAFAAAATTVGWSNNIPATSTYADATRNVYVSSGGLWNASGVLCAVLDPLLRGAAEYLTDAGVNTTLPELHPTSAQLIELYGDRSSWAFPGYNPTTRDALSVSFLDALNTHSVEFPDRKSRVNPSSTHELGIIGPAFMDALGFRYTSLSTSSTGGVTIALGGHLATQTEALGLGFKRYLLHLLASNPDKATEINEQIAKLDGHENVRIHGVRLATPLAMPPYAARDTILASKMAEVGKDIYTTSLTEGLTFKQAQNRISGLPPQSVWTAMGGTVGTVGSIVPPAYTVYMDRAAYGIGRTATVWHLVDTSGSVVQNIPEGVAYTMYFAGLPVRATAGGDDPAAVAASLQAVVGVLGEESAYNSMTAVERFGGGWLDLDPAVFVDWDGLKPDQTAGDAFLRACISLKGPNTTSTDATIADMYRIYDSLLNTG